MYPLPRKIRRLGTTGSWLRARFHVVVRSHPAHKTPRSRTVITLPVRGAGPIGSHFKRKKNTMATAEQYQDAVDRGNRDGWKRLDGNDKRLIEKLQSEHSPRGAAARKIYAGRLDK